MKALFCNDMMRFFGQKKALLIMAGLLVMYFAMGQGELVVMLMGMVGCLLTSLNALNYEEKDNELPMLFALPVSRKQYVQEKYLFGLGGSVVGTLLGAVLAAIYAVSVHKPDLLQDLPLMTACYIGGFCVFTDLMLPLMLGFGANKGRILVVGLFLLIFLMINLGITSGVLLDVTDFIFEQDTTVIRGWGIVLILAATVLITVVSYLISRRLMERREL